MKRTTKNLRLQRETIRRLGVVDLGDVAGGLTPVETTQCPTRQANCTATCYTNCNQATCIPWPDPP